MSKATDIVLRNATRLLGTIEYNERSNIEKKITPNIAFDNILYGYGEFIEYLRDEGFRLDFNEMSNEELEFLGFTEHHTSSSWVMIIPQWCIRFIPDGTTILNLNGCDEVIKDLSIEQHPGGKWGLSSFAIPYDRSVKEKKVTKRYGETKNKALSASTT